MSYRWLGVLGIGLLVSCGGDKPPAQAPHQAASPASTEPLVEAPDLSPVTRPDEVVLVGRVARPRLLLETLAQWSNVPLRLEDMMPDEARSLASAVLWEAPIDTVVALDAFGQGKLPAQLTVASLGLRSLEAGLSAADALQLPVRKVAPGIYRVGDLDDSSCAIAASLGTAPARLVCGPRSKDVDALLPYVTRGLPSEPQRGADIELVATAKPLQDRYGQQITTLRLFAGVAMREAALDVPRFDKALSDAIYGLIDETIDLFNDLDQLRVEVRLDTTRQVLSAFSELRLKGNASWTAGTFAALRPAPVPATLPLGAPGATAAFWNASYPAERYAAAARILGDLGEGYLEHEKVPEAARKRARRGWDIWLGAAPEAFTVVVPRPPSAPGKQDYAHGDSVLVRWNEPSTRVLSGATELFTALGDPALKRWAKQKYKLSDKAWPKTAKRTLKVTGFKAPATLFELTVDVEALSEESSKLGKLWGRASGLGPSNSKLLLLVQPDGDITYTLRGDDADELKRVLSEHKNQSEPAQPLATPAGTKQALGAGYVTLRLLARYLERVAQAPEIGKALAATRSRGETPIPFTWTTSASSARIDWELPAAVLADGAATAIQAGPALKNAARRAGP